MDLALSMFLALAVVSLLVALAAVVGSVRFSGRVRASPRPPPAGPQPFAAVIVACKGVDPGLEGNLEALLAQDYPSFRVIFALDRFDDDAHSVIARTSARTDVPITVVAADPIPTCTGKAAALIRAARELTERDVVVAFMDSDARPPPHWLRSLVAPLHEAGVGATTAYRWYTHDRTLPSATRAAWNAGGVPLLVDDRRNFAWGGSSALLRETLERAYIPAKWRTALSDDMVVTQAVKGLGRTIRYVPAATVLSEAPADWPSVVEWTTRQTVMMRAYDPGVTRYAGVAAATVTGSVELGAALGLVALLAAPAYALPAVLFLSHVPLLALRTAWRLRLYRRVTRHRLGSLPWFVLGGLVVPWLVLLNLARARRVRVLSWRGTLYELRGPSPVRVVRR